MPPTQSTTSPTQRAPLSASSSTTSRSRRTAWFEVRHADVGYRAWSVTQGTCTVLRPEHRRTEASLRPPLRVGLRGLRQRQASSDAEGGADDGGNEGGAPSRDRPLRRVRPLPGGSEGFARPARADHVSSATRTTPTTRSARTARSSASMTSPSRPTRPSQRGGARRLRLRPARNS